MTNPAYTELPNEGIDVTGIVGSDNDAEAEAAFERFQEAYAVATSHPSVTHFRACVRAYDDFAGVFLGAAE